MEVAAEHQVDVGFVEHGDKLLPDLNIAMPCFLVITGRDVAQHYMEGGTLVFVGGDDLAQPFHLFVAVVVIVGDAGILDVGVGFVLTGVETDEVHGTLTEGEVELGVVGAHIALEAVGYLSAGLVVAAHIVERLLRGEEFDGFVHKSVPDFIFLVED